MRLGYVPWIRGLGMSPGYVPWIRGLGMRLGYVPWVCALGMRLGMCPGYVPWVCALGMCPGYEGMKLGYEAGYSITPGTLRFKINKTHACLTLARLQ